ncbi:hypothetical protein [uncultured Paludibaculum sp.]|uniref:hypothetical protein n=1 Tax=uncultured Paludibaculum sp. TaxID=1765020 RepID=UPI002AAB3AEA|nr:hypothetical protein [uncultured Paludibaculum sp.]
MLFSWKRGVLGVATASLLGLTLWGQAAAPQWKDRAEYDLVESIKKETNAQTKLGLLQSWEQKYPNSDFKDDRFALVVGTYQALGNAKAMLETSKTWLASNPKAVQALVWIDLLTISMNDTSPAALDAGEKAAQSMLGLMDDTFSPARKPQQMTEDQWKQQRTGTESVAYRTLGWVALQRQQYEEADKNFMEALKRNPGDAQASAWAGTANLRTKKLERQGIALFHFCRAAVYEGQGAFPAQSRDQLRKSFENNYKNFHGDTTGMDDVIAKAKASPIPPDGFKLLSKDEILIAQEEELKKTNPALALWISIKRSLSGENGAAYFDSTLKNAAIPGGVEVGGTKVDKFKGKVVSCDAPKKAKKVVVGISSAEMSEVSLVFENPLAVCPDPGIELEFSGAAAAFTAEPFNLSLDVEPKDVSGLPTPPPPSARKGVPAKKAAPKKK